MRAIKTISGLLIPPVSFIIMALACGGGSGPSELKTTVGKRVKTDKFDLRVSRVFTRRSVGGMFLKEKAPKGAVFVIVRFDYKNITKEPISSFSFPSIELISPDGTKYESASGAKLAYSAQAKIDRKSLSDLNPSLSSNDAEVFEVASSLWKGGKGWIIKVDADKGIDVKVK